MIVAVIPVGMVQMTIHEVVDVIAVGHRLMTATGAMHMVRVVPGALMRGGATVGVGVRYLDHVLVDVILMRMMQVSIMQVIGMTIVFDGRMAAARAMFVIVVGMLLAAHSDLLSRATYLRQSANVWPGGR